MDIKCVKLKLIHFSKLQHNHVQYVVSSILRKTSFIEVEFSKNICVVT